MGQALGQLPLALTLALQARRAALPAERSGRAARRRTLPLAVGRVHLRRAAAARTLTPTLAVALALALVLALALTLTLTLACVYVNRVGT